MEYDRIYSIRKGEYFADALKRAGKDFIPTNCIINKLLPGLGATHCELTAPRKSIIIEPNVPVIESKAKVHKNSLAIYKGVSIRQVTDFLEKNQDKHYKLLTTPEGFTKIKEAMQAVDIDIQIQLGVSEHVFRRPDRMQEQIAAEQTDQHQHCADCGAGDHRRVDRCLHAVILLRAEKARDDHRAADVAAERERDENERHLIAVADRGQRVLPDELARDKAVGDVVKLLKNDACKQRQAEPCQHG